MVPLLVFLQFCWFACYPHLFKDYCILLIYIVKQTWSYRRVKLTKIIYRKWSATCEKGHGGIVEQKISITRKGCLLQIPIPNAPIGVYFPASLPAYGTSGLCNNYHTCTCIRGYSKHYVNPFMPSGIFYLISLDRSISYKSRDWLFLLLQSFVEISELHANSEDPDQTPRSVSSDLGLHCLSMSLLWDARLEWVYTRSK